MPRRADSQGRIESRQIERSANFAAGGADALATLAVLDAGFVNVIGLHEA